MKLNSKEVDRTMHAYLQGDGSVILIERERFRRLGCSRMTWDERRVLVRPDEVFKLFSLAHPDEPQKG